MASADEESRERGHNDSGGCGEGKVRGGKMVSILWPKKKKKRARCAFNVVGRNDGLKDTTAWQDEERRERRAQKQPELAANVKKRRSRWAKEMFFWSEKSTSGVVFFCFFPWIVERFFYKCFLLEKIQFCSWKKLNCNLPKFFSKKITPQRIFFFVNCISLYSFFDTN